MAAKI